MSRLSFLSQVSPSPKSSQRRKWRNREEGSATSEHLVVMVSLAVEMAVWSRKPRDIYLHWRGKVYPSSQHRHRLPHHRFHFNQITTSISSNSLEKLKESMSRFTKDSWSRHKGAKITLTLKEHTKTWGNRSKSHRSFFSLRMMAASLKKMTLRETKSQDAKEKRLQLSLQTCSLLTLHITSWVHLSACSSNLRVDSNRWSLVTYRNSSFPISSSSTPKTQTKWAIVDTEEARNRA